MFEPDVPADRREIVYDYDVNGNLTTIIPPGQPPHGFDYSPINLEELYTPPAASIPNPQTTYSYTPDRELNFIDRPGAATIDFDYESTTGRLRTVTIPSVVETGAGETRIYTYDPSTGQLETLSGPDATLVFGYDGPMDRSSWPSSGLAQR